jgi:Mannitol dehydrogenase C-terminal domain/Mannitol dehydrogenase Rossmann domain
VKRLHPTTIGLSGQARRWQYSRTALQTGIVHLGVGAFHRAHQAVYTDLELEQASGPWGICGVSLRRPEVCDRLAPQDGLYAVAERDGAGERVSETIVVAGEAIWSTTAAGSSGAISSRLRQPMTRRLRLLNGSHSAMAYLGCLAGFELVCEVMAAPDFVTFVRRMMAEVAPTLRVPGDLDAYQATLIARFANPALAHRTRQIAMDGSQKLPQRLLGPIRAIGYVSAARSIICASQSRVGSLTPAGRMTRAGRSRSPIRWRAALPRSAPRPVATPRHSRAAFSSLARSSASICRARSASRQRSGHGSLRC